LALVALIGLLLASLPTSVAARSTSSGPDDAVAPDDAWHPINPGAEHWYAFYYAGDGSPFQIRLQAVPEGSAAFALWTPHDRRLWADGAEVEPVGRGSPDPTADDTLVWSGSFNTGGTYYLIVEHAGSQPGPSYYTLDVTGDGVSLAPPAEPTPVPAAQPEPTQPTAPSGKILFQTTIGGTFYSIHADGSNLQPLTDGVDPIWSPDGSQIAFTRWREPRGLWIANADGSNEWRAFDASHARWPSWSPDGQEILFSRKTGAGRQDETEFCFRGLCFTFPAHPHWRPGILRPGDGSFRELLSSEIAHAPMWSPDASAIVYDDIQGLRIQNMDKSVYYMITTDPRDTGPAWAPDGRRVAFTRWQHDHWEVYVVDDSGQNLARLTTTPAKPDGKVGNSAAPAWAPDGQYIAFLTDRSGQWEIWLMRADGSAQKPMFQDQLGGLPIEYTFQSERAISWTQ
jgi:TolB protein